MYFKLSTTVGYHLKLRYSSINTTGFLLKNSKQLYYHNKFVRNATVYLSSIRSSTSLPSSLQQTSTKSNWPIDEKRAYHYCHHKSIIVHNYLLKNQLHHIIHPNIQAILQKTVSKNLIRYLSNTVIMAKTAEFQRLPKTVIPSHYNLELRPNLTEFTFVGKTAVKIVIHSPTKEIVLNAIELSLNNGQVEIGGVTHNAVDTIFSLDQETATLVFDTELPTGDAILKIEFNGELNDKMKGFYRSKYFTATGEERYAGVTQFEATDARRCFPCWDEPAIKATFSVSLVVPEDRVALSNMPIYNITGVKDEPKLRRISFQKTPIMSTYLVAVVVGEFDCVEDKSSDGVVVRVFTPVGKKEQGTFALEVATKVLPYYKDYFGIAYPLPKMDLIAIADFSAGAMENWGLVTYRETFLLVDPENTSLIGKQSIALTVGHEIAHQWFGNLVTMEWWTHLWLNEGYASFVEFLCVDKLFPQYDIWTQFVTDMYTSALKSDCLKNSHPIEVPVGHPSEIDEIFDEISYNKGACVIRMLYDYIGEKGFCDGMNLYLTRHQYKNTVTEDLWSALEETSKKPVAAVMSTWIKQMGFPLVTVSSVQTNETTRTLTLTQEKFTADGCVPSEEYFWMIPITISTSADPQKKIVTTVLDKKTTTIELPNVSQNDWVKVNPGTVGYYRTKYSTEMLDSFISAIKSKELPPLDRLGLLDDLFALVQAGLASTGDYLRLVEAYSKEDNYTVWTSITNSMSKLQLLLSHTTLQDTFNLYGQQLYRPIAEQLGWNARSDESHLDTLLRSLVLNKLVSFEYPNVLQEAKTRFKRHASGEALIPADIRSACYKAALKEDNVDTYNEMLRLYRATDLHEEKDRISRSLGALNDKVLLQKVIDFAISKEVRAQDAIFVLVAVAINPRGRDIIWDYFRENVTKLSEQYQGSYLLSRLIKYATENFATEEKAKEVEDFFKENPFPGTERTVSQSIETIRLNQSWLERDFDKISAFLTAQK